jgi:hypothetical protein
MARDAFVELLPSKPYKAIVAIDLKDLGVTQPGNYEIDARYHSPVPRTLGFGLHILSREDGEIAANHVTIKVVN